MKPWTLGAVLALAAGPPLIVSLAGRTESASAGGPIYPTLAAHSDLVSCGPYDTIQSGPPNWGAGTTGAVHSREFLTFGNRYRIRESGALRRIRINLQDTTGLSGFTFRIWRQVGSTFSLVGSSENLAPSMVAGPNTLDLNPPLTVQEGDFYGYRIESDQAANFFARQDQASVNSYFVTDATPGDHDFDWQAQEVNEGAVLPIEMYMQAPVLVAIGDSELAGYPLQHTFLEPVLTLVPGTDAPFYVASQWGITWQNMAVSSQSTGQIADRFDADVVDLKPRLALMEGGTAGLYTGADTQATFLADWKQMLDSCQMNDIQPLVLLMLPGTRLTTAQSQTRDLWNSLLRDLASHYPGAVVIDASPYIGVYRPGGAPDNRWDFDPAYNAGDGLHPNAAGHRQIAQAIIDQYAPP